MMIRVECKFASSIGRFELEDYISPVDLSVYGYAADGEQVLMGKFSADQLRSLNADYDNVDLISICDNHSGEMLELITVLFDAEFKLQPELEIDLPLDQVLFIWNAVLHPSISHYHSAILETVCNMLGNQTVIVMRQGICSLSMRELADLKFAKIAGTEFLIRHTGFLSEYAKVNPQGIEVPHEFEADVKFEEWVRERWDEEPR